MQKFTDDLVTGLLGAIASGAAWYAYLSANSNNIAQFVFGVMITMYSAMTLVRHITHVYRRKHDEEDLDV